MEIQSNYQHIADAYKAFMAGPYCEHVPEPLRKIEAEARKDLENMHLLFAQFDVADIASLELARSNLSYYYINVKKIAAIARALAGGLSIMRSYIDSIEFIKWRDQKIGVSEAEKRARAETIPYKYDEVFWDQIYQEMTGLADGIREQANAIASKVNSLKKSQDTQTDYEQKQVNTTPVTPAQVMNNDRVQSGEVNKMPSNLLQFFRENKQYHLCWLTGKKGDQTLQGKLELHHAFTYAGREIQEFWAIMPVLHRKHQRDGDKDSIHNSDVTKKYVQWILLSNYLKEGYSLDAIQEKYPKKDWKEIYQVLVTRFTNVKINYA